MALFLSSAKILFLLQIQERAQNFQMMSGTFQACLCHRHKFMETIDEASSLIIRLDGPG